MKENKKNLHLSNDYFFSSARDPKSVIKTRKNKKSNELMFMLQGKLIEENCFSSPRTFAGEAISIFRAAFDYVSIIMS